MSATRCPWPKTDLDLAYHDTEWGRPLHDDRKLFEMLILEGMQAGLSWSTILAKRETMRQAFDQFDPEIMQNYGEAKVLELMNNSDVIRNKLKLQALAINARAYLAVQEEYGSFAEYIWSFVDGEPIVNAWADLSQIPAKTPISDAMSKSLLKKGFKFVGSTICYAFMQAAGLVNDHLVSCEQYAQCNKR